MENNNISDAEAQKNLKEYIQERAKAESKSQAEQAELRQSFI